MTKKENGKLSIAEIGVVFAIIAGIFSCTAYMVREAKVELKEDIQAVSIEVKNMSEKLDSMVCSQREDDSYEGQNVAEEKESKRYYTKNYRRKEDESK